MSGISNSPVMTPSTVTMGKEQLVIIEFPRDLPQNAGIITFSFYHSGKKLSTIPVVTLGPRVLKARFPEFSIYGEVEVIVHINREEKTAIPRFKFNVQSQLEAIFGCGVALEGVRQVALLASVLAYLSHCDERSRELAAQADPILTEILQRVNTFELSDWTLKALLAGKHGNEENLLHFCTRRGLTETATYLLLGMTHSKKHEYLIQKAADNKTPVDLARKNDMRQFVGLTEQMMQGSPNISSKKRSNAKRKSRFVEKSRSIDSDINRLCVPGSPDAHSFTQNTQYPTEQRGRKVGSKESRAAKVFRHFRKDKGMVVSQPQQAYVNEYGEPLVVPGPPPHSPTLTLSRSMEPIASSCPEHSNDPFSESSYHLASPYGTSSPQSGSPLLSVRPTVPEGNYHLATTYGTSSPQPSSPLLSARHDQLARTAVTFPRTVRPASRTESIGSSSSSFDQGDPRLALPPRPMSSSLSGTSDYGSALSNAIRDLKTRALYLAEVVREYVWLSVSQGDSDTVLKVGDRVFVTQEGVEGDPHTCLGVWNGRYGRLPLAILKRLPQTELDLFRDHQEEEVSEDDYEKVDDNLWAGEGDEDDIYKVPRNVPVGPYLAGSDSGDEQPVYDVPPNRVKTEGLHVEEADSEDDQPVYDVPPNRLQGASPQVKEPVDDEDDPVYDIPPSGERSPTPDEHDYLNIGHGMFPMTSLTAQLFSQAPQSILSQPAAGQSLNPSPHNPSQPAVTDSVSSSYRREENMPHKTDGPQFSTRAPGMERGQDTDDTVMYDTLMEISKTQQEATSVRVTTTPKAPPITTQTSPTLSTSHHHLQHTSTSLTGPLSRREREGVEASDVYSTLIPKSEVLSDVSGRGYNGLESVKNSIQNDINETRKGRGDHTQDMSRVKSDDVFKKSGPAPTPKKRSRLPTDPPPKTSPKPKPRRQTAATTNSECEESASRIEEILANSKQRGEVRIGSAGSHTPPSLRKQELNGDRKQPYVNIEVREEPRRTMKPPPSPPRTHGPPSSPATRKQPPVAPKPAHKRK